MESQNSKDPFIIMTILYIALGLLAALQAALVPLGYLKSPVTLTWVRIHFVTLGILTQTLFGAIPRSLGSKRSRWDIWLLLNSGIFTFFFGRSIIDFDVMLTGAVLLFIATILFMIQVAGIGSSSSRYFYIVGSFFLLIGITVGAGIWGSWKSPLGVVGSMVEVHIHANNWGFMSMIFTGVVIDLYSSYFKVEMKWKGSLNTILILETLGALGLVFGPWLGNTPVIVIGMLFFIVATVWFLLAIILPVKDKTEVGFLHLALSYVWIFMPLFFAPFVLFEQAGFEQVEPNAPQALIYGWVLQAGVALVPYFISKAKGTNPKLGGSWISLIGLNLGAAILWIAIFSGDLLPTLLGTAYVIWTLSIIPFLLEVYKLFTEE